MKSASFRRRGHLTWAYASDHQFGDDVAHINLEIEPLHAGARNARLNRPNDELVGQRAHGERYHQREVRTFKTTTRDLLALSEWLANQECTHIATRRPASTESRFGTFLVRLVWADNPLAAR